MEETDSFLEYFSAYSELSDEYKQKEILTLFKENKELMNKVIKDNGLDKHVEIARCLGDDDFLNEVFVYLNLERELLGEYILNKEGEI